MQTILKLDTPRRRVFAVALTGGVPDSQGDIVDDDEIEHAAWRMAESRPVVKVDHAGPPVGRVICAWPMTQEIAKSFGFDLPAGQSALLVGLQVESDATWQAIERGEIGHAVSIGGRGTREEAA